MISKTSVDNFILGFKTVPLVWENATDVAKENATALANQWVNAKFGSGTTESSELSDELLPAVASMALRCIYDRDMVNAISGTNEPSRSGFEVKVDRIDDSRAFFDLDRAIKSKAVDKNVGVKIG